MEEPSVILSVSNSEKSIDKDNVFALSSYVVVTPVPPVNKLCTLSWRPSTISDKSTLKVRAFPASS